MTERNKVSVEDIIGLVQTDEETDSVEEVRKLRGRKKETEPRFTITQDFEEHHRQIRDNGHIIMGCFVEPQAEVIVDLLNELHEENKKLKQVNEMLQMDFVMTERNLMEENEQLKQKLQKIQDDFELNWTQNRVEFDKDKLYIKDTNTETCLDNRNLSIRVRIPSLNEYYLFKYKVTGRSLMKEFVEKYNSKGDVE